MLSFGYLVDRAGRKIGMILATLIIIVFTILCAGAYGAGGSTTGMLQVSKAGSGLLQLLKCLLY